MDQDQRRRAFPAIMFLAEDGKAFLATYFNKSKK